MPWAQPKMKSGYREFPGGLLVGTLRFHHTVQSLVWELRFPHQVLRTMAKKQKKKEVESPQPTLKIL